MSDSEHQFDLSGGALCLDFANTVGDRPHGRQEHLGSYADLLAWGWQAGALSGEEVERLRRSASRRAEERETVFARAVELRETIFRIFSRLARGERAARRDLASLNAALNEALPYLEVERGAEEYGWNWRGPGSALDRMLWPVARSAAELLTSVEARFVRECGSDRCSWLFVDRSRTRRRRWCDMATCGNRAKARRYYERTKKKGKPAGAT